MTLSVALVFISSLLVSLVIAHMHWCHVRDVVFREELFWIRDRLWDDAKVLKAFEDPAYLQARNHLNAAIRGASWLNLWTLLYSVGKSDRTATLLVKSAKPDVQGAIDKSLDEFTAAVFRHCFGRSLSGWVVRGFFVSVYSLDSLRKWAKDWVVSAAPESFSRQATA